MTDVQKIKKPETLLDDGEFYIEHNAICAANTGNGFLLRRCATSVLTPGGYECIGGYENTPGRKWRAFIDAPYDAETDSESRNLGSFDDRLSAITALWKNRHDALCRHK